MKYLVIRDGETIKHVEPIGHDFAADNVLVLNEMPVYQHQPGKVAKLKYTDAEGVHYEYTDAPSGSEVSGEELMHMLEGVL